MDETPDRFTYRCLPLSMANAHGWDFQPVRVCRALERRCRDRRRRDQARSRRRFASKDGIAALGGVSETDWSPYSFTMNWRFTRPNHWIRFDEDEPFCFFLPVQRSLFDHVRPELRPLEDAPELMAAFRQWSESCLAFQQGVRDDPGLAAEKWQKLYHRGVGPDGSAGASDHRTKLRLAEFRDLRPSRALPAEPGSRAPTAYQAGRLSVTMRIIGLDPPAGATKAG